jgi:hypothetical protein
MKHFYHSAFGMLRLLVRGVKVIEVKNRENKIASNLNRLLAERFELQNPSTQ